MMKKLQTTDKNAEKNLDKIRVFHGINLIQQPTGKDAIKGGWSKLWL